jgi:hypothetical protein
VEHDATYLHERLAEQAKEINHELGRIRDKVRGPPNADLQRCGNATLGDDASGYAPLGDGQERT